MQSEKTGAEGTALKKWEITGYGLGGFASTLPNQFKTQFGMSFMTDVAGGPHWDRGYFIHGHVGLGRC